MPKHARCAVGFCDNDKRYPDLAYVRSHENNLMFRKWPVDPKLVKIRQSKKRRHEAMYSILPQVIVVLSSLQIIYLWKEELLKTLKRIIRQFL